jgi:Mn2+/Fe2+ NRAMP family transporter
MSNKKGILTGAAFLMATSAIGPGFITQTTQFTANLLYSFGFVIVISLLLDIVVQLNIWRVVGAHNQFAPQLANQVFPYAGHILSVLIVLGAFAFNIANMAGAALGLQVLLGIDLPVGTAISAVVALGVFLFKEAGRAIDAFAKLLGFVMIALVLYVLLQNKIPLGPVLKNSVWPERVDTAVVLTIVGGTVGGYISFAGIHRLLNGGVAGKAHLSQIGRSAVMGITVATVMRALLFLAVLGVVLQGVQPDAGNPAATVFQHAAGSVGYRLFGLVLWCAAITSVVGSAFTSVSFAQQLHPVIQRRSKTATVLFIVLSGLLFVLIGKPKALLLLAGAVNGLVLPFALAVILLAANKKSLAARYAHPLWLTVAGWLVVAAMAYMSWFYIQTLFAA